ncbi:hypothetical protein JZ751_017257 [Albula glossodonta]|uniref:Uncharacterized protein n=1 Tax=Albula glossodonta TaxID=121402 RepID=A0A8T2MUP3_9TELE|nr:hypothetical protein JZ751_017257 [Albula glossodonta]
MGRIWAALRTAPSSPAAPRWIREGQGRGGKGGGRTEERGGGRGQDRGKEDRARGAEESRRRYIAEEPRRRYVAEEPRRRYTAEEPWRRYTAEKPRRRYTAKELRRRYTAEEPRRRYTAEELRRRYTAEEPRRRYTAKELRRRYTAEEPRRRYTAEEQAPRGRSCSLLTRSMSKLSRQSGPMSKLSRQSGPMCKLSRQSGPMSKLSRQIGPMSKLSRQSGSMYKLSHWTGPMSKLSRQSGPMSKLSRQSGPMSKLSRWTGPMSNSHAGVFPCVSGDVHLCRPLPVIAHTVQPSLAHRLTLTQPPYLTVILLDQTQGLMISEAQSMKQTQTWLLFLSCMDPSVEWSPAVFRMNPDSEPTLGDELPVLGSGSCLDSLDQLPLCHMPDPYGSGQQRALQIPRQEAEGGCQREQSVQVLLNAREPVLVPESHG